MTPYFLRRAAITLALGLVSAAAASAHGWSVRMHHPPYFHGSWAWAPYVWGETGYDPRYEDAGALDLDVTPEQAEVYVDGRYVGKADDFDGFPTYLWLEQGTYDVVIYLPGYQTLSRQYSVYPGAVVDVEDNLEAGESVRPEDLPSKSTEHRDARLRRDEERRQEAEARRQPQNQADDRYAEGDWRDRRSRPRSSGEGAGAQVVESRGGDQAVAAQGGRLRLTVEPDDASVYLDGRFVGTGEELAGQANGLLVDDGEHRLETVRPGRASRTLRFTISTGETVTLEVKLDPAESPNQAD
jgi:hypothetical protein